jgi:hypothetical protein
VQQTAVRRTERALLRSADRGDLVVDARAFGRRQYVSRRRRIEHAQSNIRALTDVFEEPQHAFAAVRLHHRRLDIGDVGAGALSVQCEIQAVLGRHGGCAGLHHDVRVGGSGFLDRHLQQALSFVERQ